MQKSVKLSIIMPVFNHRNDVATMIDCIRVNNFADWELLIVDDGSDVETLDMLAEYVKIDQRIRIIRRERTPKGAPTCRNLGFDVTKCTRRCNFYSKNRWFNIAVKFLMSHNFRRKINAKMDMQFIARF